jgi:mono/diheme cytochrome c family protein
MKHIIFGRSVFWGILMWWCVSMGWTAVADGPRSGTSEDVTLIPSIQGPALYKAYCASCHGSDAKGGGPMAKALKISPADLTRISTRNGGTLPLARISRIISGDAQVPGGHGTREMPVWGPIFSHVDSDQDLGRVRIDNLARYLRELQLGR